MDTKTTQFTDKIYSAITENTCIKLIISKSKNSKNNILKITIKPVILKNTTMLSFVYKLERSDTTKNFEISEGITEIVNQLESNFEIANLLTTNQDIEYKQAKNKEAVLIFKKSQLTEPANLQHDNVKKRFINTQNNSYLQKLGITGTNGMVLPSMNFKYIQIEKFIEVVDNIVNNFNADKEIRITDMGSGKGYLTFALYDYLQNAKKFNISVTGIETQQNLVNICNTIASDINFSNLQFKQGTISNTAMHKCDMLIALHACDTATDDALFYALQTNCEIIVCAPCCHKQIRKQIKTEGFLAPLIKYGIFAERTSEMITDLLRALILNLNGYDTKIFEFTPLETSGKNVMITALKHNRKINTEEIENQIKAIKTALGISYHYLEKLIENPSDQSFRNLNAVCNIH